MPSCEPSERITLGACFSSRDIMGQCADILDPSAFYHGVNAVVFAQCIKRYNANLKVESHSVILDIEEKLTPEDVKYVIECREFYNREMDASEHIRKLAELCRLRQLYYSSLRLARDISKGEDSSSTIAMRYIDECGIITSGSNRDIRMINSVISLFSENNSFIEALQKRRDRIESGGSPFDGVRSFYPLLDRALGGFQNGCLHYIGARTSMGKTTFALNVIRNIIRSAPDVPVAIFSLEMTAETITAKIICMNASVDYNTYTDCSFQNDEYMRLTETARILSTANLYIDDSPCDIASLSSRIRRLVRAHGIKIVFIDYLTCIKASDSTLQSNHLRVDSVSKGLLAIAKELKIPVVCLAQLNRNVTARIDKSPTLADFREGGEEDADVCLLLHRPRYYDTNSTDDTTHIIVAKNRLLGNLCRINYVIDNHSPSVYRELPGVDTVSSSSIFAPKEKPQTYNYYDR